MEILVTIIIVVFGVLQIILFFKLWGMTDDIRAIKNKYLYRDNDRTENSTTQRNTSSSTEDKENTTSTSTAIININSLVVRLSDGNKMRVTNLTEDGAYECSLNGKDRNIYEPNEIMEFNKWTKEVYRKQ